MEYKQIEDKTLFDGRITYHTTLNLLNQEVHKSRILNDVFRMFDALNSVFITVSPFINQDQAKLISEKLEKLENKISVLSSGSKTSLNTYSIKKELNNIHKDIFYAGKKLFLPIQEVQNEMDWNEFNKQSE